jgi:hypothetical protein
MCGFVLSELMYPLVREAKKARSISGAHLQTTSSQQSNGSPGCQGGSSVLLVGLPSQRCVRADGFRRARRELDVIDELCSARAVDEHLHGFNDAAPRFIHGATLCVAPTQFPDRSDPPTRSISFVGDVIRLHDFFNHPFPRHGSRSRSIRRSNPGPISSPACTGTVVTHAPHSTRTCDPFWRVSTQP